MKKIIGWSAALNVFLLTGILSLLFSEKTSDVYFFTIIGVIFIFIGLISFLFLIINMYKNKKND